MIAFGFRYLKYRFLACFSALFMIGLAVSVYGGPFSLNYAVPLLGAAFVSFAAATGFALLHKGAAAYCAALIGALLLGPGYQALREALIRTFDGPAVFLRLPELWSAFNSAAAIVRAKIIEFCENPLLSADESALLCGILIGSKDGFSDLLYEIMSASGFMHIAAVSGLHIGFLCAFMSFCLRRLRCAKRAALTIPVLLFYMAAAAFTPSVCRAVIMCSVYLAARIVLRTPDPLTSLSASALLMCLIDPETLKSVSFLMSYAATISLLLFMPPVTELASAFISRISLRASKRLPYSELIAKTIYSSLMALTASAAASLSSQIGIMPIILHYFHRVSIMSFIGNVIVIPCTMAVFVTGLVCSALWAAFPAAASIIGYIFVKPQLKIILSCAGAFSKFAYSPLHRPGPSAVILFYLLALLLWSLVVKASAKYNESPLDAS